MSEEEKISFANSRKEVGTHLFKQKRFGLALGRYKKITEMFQYTDNMKDETMKAEAKNLKTLCELNKALCFLKCKEFSDAKKACDTVLKDEPSNAKALYRRAQAHYELGDISECMHDLKCLLKSESQNKEARDLLKKARLAQREEDKNSKGMFKNMCKALGTGQIPEPYVEKKTYDESSSDEDHADNEGMSKDANVGKTEDKAESVVEP